MGGGEPSKRTCSNTTNNINRISFKRRRRGRRSCRPPARRQALPSAALAAADLGVIRGSYVSCWVHALTGTSARTEGCTAPQAPTGAEWLAPILQRRRVPCPAVCPDPCHLQFTETDGPITIHYNKYTDGSKIGTPATLEVDMVIGADGANSRVAKEIDAGEYDYAIAFQERIRIPGESVCRRHWHCCMQGLDSTAGPVCLCVVECGSHATRETRACAAVACCADAC